MFHNGYIPLVGFSAIHIVPVFNSATLGKLPAKFKIYIPYIPSENDAFKSPSGVQASGYAPSK